MEVHFCVCVLCMDSFPINRVGNCDAGLTPRREYLMDVVIFRRFLFEREYHGHIISEYASLRKLYTLMVLHRRILTLCWRCYQLITRAPKVAQLELEMAGTVKLLWGFMDYVGRDMEAEVAAHAEQEPPVDLSTLVSNETQQQRQVGIYQPENARVNEMNGDGQEVAMGNDDDDDTRTMQCMPEVKVSWQGSVSWDRNEAQKDSATLLCVSTDRIQSTGELVASSVNPEQMSTLPSSDAIQGEQVSSIDNDDMMVMMSRRNDNASPIVPPTTFSVTFSRKNSRTLNLDVPPKPRIPNLVKNKAVGSLFECPTCFVKFTKKEDLHLHLFSHDSKPYKCPECGKGFTRRGNVTQHQEAVHQLLKPFQCFICWKRFYRQTTLWMHLRTHAL